MRRLLGVFAVTLLAAAPALGWEHWGGDRDAALDDQYRALTTTEARLIDERCNRLATDQE